MLEPQASSVQFSDRCSRTGTNKTYRRPANKIKTYLNDLTDF